MVTARTSRVLRLAGILSVAAFLSAVPALAQSPPAGPGSRGYGPGMMGSGGGEGCGYGYGMGGMAGGMMGYGYGSGMMRGQGPHWAGKGGIRGDITANLDALKTQLKITGQQEPAWKAYGNKVEATNKKLWDAMSGMHQPGMMWDATPEQRLGFMRAMIQLRQQQITELKSAADELMPHLDAYQKGQASVILPGLARGGYGACAMGY